VETIEIIQIVYLTGIIYCVSDMFIFRAKLIEAIAEVAYKKFLTNKEIATFATIAVFIYVVLWPVFKAREFYKWMRKS
jgi:ABC-type uncharacterized transport system fused permease/ATPase subunit